ncbi:MAG: outer membrane beta-barrel protein [Woeseiaceae bacterium]
MQDLSVRKSSLFNVVSTCASAAALGLMPIGHAFADSGPYIGGSVGSVTIQAEIPDENLGEVFEFDENDFAWKAFGGYNFDLAVVDLAIEGGYVDLGSPSGDFIGSSVALDVTGWDVFGLVGVNLGPVGLFAKAGMITWDAEATIDSIGAAGDDGTDPAYGVGVRVKLGTLEIRGEYEYFDIDSVDDVYMLSAGLVFNFGG